MSDEMIEKLSEAEILRLVTEVTRKADERHEKVGGGTRHWVRECFLEELEDADRIAVLEQSLDKAFHYLADRDEWAREQGLTFEAVRGIFMRYATNEVSFGKAVEQLRDLAAVAAGKEFPRD